MDKEKRNWNENQVTEVGKLVIVEPGDVVDWSPG